MTSINALPKQSLVVQVTRAKVCDTDALYRRVLNDELFLAADVFDEEPLPSESPLWRARGMLITPHVAGVTHVEEAGQAFLDALTQMEAGETPSTQVDPILGY